MSERNLTERLVEAIEALAGMPPIVRLRFDRSGYFATVFTRDGDEVSSSFWRGALEIERVGGKTDPDALTSLTSLLFRLIERLGSPDTQVRLTKIPQRAADVLRLVPEVQAYMAARALGATS